MPAGDHAVVARLDRATAGFEGNHPPQLIPVDETPTVDCACVSLSVYPEGTFTTRGEPGRQILFEGAEETQGFWNGLDISSDNRNVLDHVVIRHAGGRTNIRNRIKGGLYLQPGSLVSLTNSTFEACEYYGVRARGEVWFHEFADNVFRDNGREALRIPAMAMGALDERSTYDGGNGHDRVKIYGNEIMADVTLSPLDVTYYFTDSVRLDEPVTIEGGTDLRFDGGRTIGAEGPEFVVDGSEEAPVTFDKAADADGHWGGIEVAPDCVASFGHCTITNGGQDTGNLYVSAGGYAIIESLSVANSATNGIYAERESDLNETGNSTYSGNSECDIYYDDSDVCIEQ